MFIHKMKLLMPVICNLGENVDKEKTSNSLIELCPRYEALRVMGDRAWWERGTQDSLIWTQIHSINANTYRAKIKCVRFLYRYSTYNTGHRALSRTCSRKFLHTNF